VEGVYSGSEMKAFKGPEAQQPSHSSYPNRSEQNSSKFWHTMQPLNGSFGEFKGLTVRHLYGLFGVKGLTYVVFKTKYTVIKNGSLHYSLMHKITYVSLTW